MNLKYFQQMHKLIIKQQNSGLATKAQPIWLQIAKEVIGKCPVCGSDVYEGKTNYYCSDRSCQFALWKSNRFLESMKKSMDKKMAVELLKKGRTHVKGLYSKKKDSKFDADLVLGLEDGKARFSLEFPKKKK